MSTSTLTWRHAFAFSVLALFLHELHELAHTITARLICGAWGARDFNVWHLAAGCSSYVPTAIGPLFSYAVMFLGVLLIVRRTQWIAGVALALAPNPFARLLTAAMGGGDEMVLARVIAESGKTPLLRVAVLIVVGALALPPIVAAWRALGGVQRRMAWFVALLLGPVALTGVLYLVIGNRLLAAGVMTTPAIGGDPLLLFITTVTSALLTLLTFRWLWVSRQAESIDFPGAIAAEG
jgi:hypothetical protein